MRRARYRLMAAAFLAMVSGLTSVASAQTGGSSSTATARSQLQVAQANVDQIKDVALRALGSDPAWIAAKRTASEADDRLEAARVRARGAAHESTGFADLEAKLKTAATDAQKADIRGSMRALEATAIMDSAEVKDARTAKIEAVAAVSRLWDDYEAKVLAHDPRWISAVAARDQARATLAAANAAQASTSHGGGGARRSTAASSTRSSRSRRGRY